MSPGISAFRTVAGGLLSILLSLTFVGLVTLDSLGYWGNFVVQLVAFIAAGWIGGRVAIRWPGWTVGISLFITYGAIAIFVGLNSLRSGGPIKSAGLVIVYIVAATVSAAILGKRRKMPETPPAA